MRQYGFAVLFFCLFLSIVVIAAIHTSRARKARGTNWQSLMKRIVSTNRENIALVALDLIDEGSTRRSSALPELTSEQIWTLIDGMEGLDRIEANCQVFIEIAMYIQRAHPEAVVVAEEFRRSTRHIQWHLSRLRESSHTGNLAHSFAEYAQRAVASYYVMSKQLLTMCEQTEFAGLDRLRNAV